MFGREFGQLRKNAWITHVMASLFQQIGFFKKWMEKRRPYPLPLSRTAKDTMARCLRERGFERQKMDERTKSVHSSIFMPVPRKMSELASEHQAIFIC